jgi:hypothetical protein|mmetsp:Transcript_39402/g.62486  ORF Transcript_39402/g.62486 Transcript_39402/m.62486 type:complete len:369 (-) Transcript_39402:63-1169(-)
MATLGLLILLVFAFDPSAAARIKARAASLKAKKGLSKNFNSSLNSLRSGNNRFHCDADAIFHQIMLFNAETAGETNYVLSFQGGSGSKIVAELKQIAEASGYRKRMFFAEEGSRIISVVLPYNGEALPNFLPSNRAGLANFRLNHGTLIAAGPMLGDYMQDAVGLARIINDEELHQRHRSQTGLFSKGITQEEKGHPGPQELVEWMRAACAEIGDSDEERFLEMILAASLIIVRNQIFSDRNHRSAMRIIEEALPNDVKSMFRTDVVSYSGSNQTMRDALYREMHNPHAPFETLAPFSSGLWSSVVSAYRSILNSWLTAHDHPLVEVDAPTVCHTDKECAALGMNCYNMDGKRTFSDWCKAGCFCASG